MDIGLNTNDGNFKARACGVIIKDGKVLLEKSRRFDGYVFVGGHMKLGENSRDTVIRECEEELGVKCQIEKLICINENIFESESLNKVCQEISYYYLLTPLSPLPDDDFDRFEIDNGREITHYYSWVDIANYKEYNIRPNWIMEMILTNTENKLYLSDQIKKIYM